MNCGSVSIKGMNCFVFNEEAGRYEPVAEFITGKSPQQIAAEYGDVTYARTRQYAKERKLPYLGTATRVNFYLFDPAAEEAFVNRPRESPGRRAAEKPVKIPGKPGRPRKEKPVDTSPKRPVGRPRKNPIEAMDVVSKNKRKKTRK
jgi:hypothetical protein